MYPNERDYKLNQIKKNINTNQFKEVLKLIKKYEQSRLFK